MTLPDIFTSELGRRTVTDLFLSMTAIGTSPWWLGVDINHWAQIFVLWVAVATAVIRLYGMAKDIIRGKTPHPGEDD